MKDLIKNLKIPIKEILIEESLIDNIAIILSRLGFNQDKKLRIISDNNISNSLNLNQILKESLDKDKLILKSPKADQKTVDLIVKNSQNYDLIIAIGSGTINDLCKLASFKLRIPYIIFASAPSMNGFASANSSILIQGHKKTLKAHLPLALYFDLNILKNAPKRLIKAGIGDSVCMSTCQFDWLLSHLLLDTYYNPQAFEILQPYHQQLLEVKNSNIRDKNFIKLLSEILIISGISMYISNGSYPASQAEHLIAHYLEMRYPAIMTNSYHGEQIAITTLKILQIQQKILEVTNMKIKSSTIDENHINNLFGKDLGKKCLYEIKKKIITADKSILINNRLSQEWTEIKYKLQNTLTPYDKLKELYKIFDLPQNPQQIGLSDDLLEEAINNAHLIRDRFTSLDINNGGSGWA